jgi:predicted ATPase
VLLVFDGAERLGDPLGDFVEHLLETAPHVTALVTSRSPLHVLGEQLLEVSPMELPEGDRTQRRHSEAVELFLDRLGAAANALSPDETEAIEELCHLVDGLPLGIELAAAQATRIPVTAILAQLESNQQAVLAMHRSDARSSDPSLGLVLERTMQLLSPSQRTLLGRLAVFRASFDMSGVRAIAGYDVVVEDFGRLCEVALVMPDPRSGATRRFRLLDTTRAFATRLLTREESVSVARAHAEYFRSFARHASDQLDGPDVLRRLRREASNLRAALRWFLANDPGGAPGFGRALSELAETWLDRTEAVALFERLLVAADHDPGASESDRAWIEVGIGWPLFLTGDPARAVELTEHAAATFSSLGDHSGACQAFTNRAHMELLSTANQELASVWYRRALDELGDASHPHLRATVLVEAAQSLILADRCDERVDEMLDEAEGILREFRDHHRLAHLAMDRSLAAYAIGDLDAVAEFARMNLHESRLANTRIFAQIGETALGVKHLHTDDLDGALDHLRTAVSMARDQGNVLQVGIALQAVAVHHALTGRITEAKAIWTTARSLAPLWPLFGRRYPELMGPQLTQQLDDAFTTHTANADAVPLDRLLDRVLDESPLAPPT